MARFAPRSRLQDEPTERRIPIDFARRPVIPFGPSRVSGDSHIRALHKTYRLASQLWLAALAFMLGAVPQRCLAQQARTATSTPIHTPNLFHREFWVALSERLTERAVEAIIQCVCILAVYLVMKAALNGMINAVTAGLIAREERLGVSQERAGRLKTLGGLLKSMIGYLLFFVFGVLMFKAIGFDIMPFVTTAGIIGLAIGFGAQKLVKDVISGFFIIVDNMFVVGDTISVGAVTGQVQEMGMRITRLEDSNGKVIMISNGDIGTVTNLSRNPVQDYIEVAVDASIKMNDAAAAINAAGEAMFAAEDHTLKSAPQLIGVSAFSAASVTLRISVVADPTAITAEEMKVREEMRAALNRAGIVVA